MKRTLAGLLAVAALTLGARADDDPLEEVFRNVDAKSTDVKDLRAEFRQTKKMKIMKRPIETTGTLHVRKTDKGSRVCWESWLLDVATGEKMSPRRTLFLADEQLMWDYDVEEKLAERTDLGKGKFEVGEVLTVGGSLSGLKQAFEISLTATPANGRGWRLALVPRSERLKKFIRELELEVDPAQWVVSRIHVVDTGDTVTDIVLSGFRMNQGVEESVFGIPSDVKVTNVEFK